MKRNNHTMNIILIGIISIIILCLGCSYYSDSTKNIDIVENIEQTTIAEYTTITTALTTETTTTTTTCYSYVTTLYSTTNYEIIITPIAKLAQLPDTQYVTTIAYEEDIELTYDNVIDIENEIEEEEYIVFKPQTHYIHKNTCYWAGIGEVYNIETTEGIIARKCTECNPEIEIENIYEEPEEYSSSIDNDEILMLRNIVSYEYGSDWVSIYDKACIVAGVMNRVNDERFPDTIYGVLTQSGQFPGFNPYGDYYISDSIIDAVDYYFNNSENFGNYNSWTGDGSVNYFYYQ